MVKTTLLSVIYLPAGEAAHWVQQCVTHCAVRGYTVIAIATDFADVIKMLMAGTAQVAVTGHRGMVPTDLIPRLEVVAEEQTHAPLAPAQRRLVRRRNLAEDR